MPSDLGPWGVGVIGQGPQVRFLLQRLSQRTDFVAAAHHDPEIGRAAWADCDSHSTAAAVIQDPRTRVIYMAGPAEAEQIDAALHAGKSLILSTTDGLTAHTLRRWGQSAQEGRSVAVIDEARRWDEDFLCAKTVVDRGVLGTLSRIRLSIHERCFPQEQFAAGALRELGIHWLDQLLAFVNSDLQHATLRTFSDSGDFESGFVAMMEFRGETSAIIELHLQSLLSLRTGWLLEGSTGAYRNGRLYTKTGDGEIIDEPVGQAEIGRDPFFDSLAGLLNGTPGSHSLPDFIHAAKVVELVEELSRSGRRADSHG